MAVSERVIVESLAYWLLLNVLSLFLSSDVCIVAESVSPAEVSDPFSLHDEDINIIKRLILAIEVFIFI